MGLLKYAFDNKIAVTNECYAAQRGEFLSYPECCYPSKNTKYKLPDFFHTYLISCIWRWIKHNFETEQRIWQFYYFF